MAPKNKEKEEGPKGQAKAATRSPKGSEAEKALPDVQPFRDRLKKFVDKLDQKDRVDKEDQSKGSSATKEMRAFIKAADDLLLEMDVRKLDCSEKTKGDFLRRVVQSLIESKPEEPGMIVGIATVLQHYPKDDQECKVLQKALELIGVVYEAHKTASPELGSAISSVGGCLERLAVQQRNAKSHDQKRVHAIILQAARQDKLFQNLLSMKSADVVELFNGLCVWLLEYTAYEQSLSSKHGREKGDIPNKEHVSVRNDIGDAMEVLFEALRRNDFMMNCQGDRNSWPVVNFSAMLVAVLKNEDFKGKAAECLARLSLLFELRNHESRESASSGRGAMNKILLDSSDILWGLLTCKSGEEKKVDEAAMVTLYILILSSGEEEYVGNLRSNDKLFKELMYNFLAVLKSLAVNICRWSASHLQFIASFLLNILLRDFVMLDDELKHQQSIKQQLALTMRMAYHVLLSSDDSLCRTMGGRILATICAELTSDDITVVIKDLPDDTVHEVLSKMTEQLKVWPILANKVLTPRRLPEESLVLKKGGQWDKALDILNDNFILKVVQTSDSFVNHLDNIVSCTQSLLDNTKCKIRKEVPILLAEPIVQFCKPEHLQRTDWLESLEKRLILSRVYSLHKSAYVSFKSAGGTLSSLDDDGLNAALNVGVLHLLRSPHDLTYDAWTFVLQTLCADYHQCAFLSFAFDRIRMMKPSICGGEEDSEQRMLYLWEGKVIAMLKIGLSQKGLASPHIDEITEEVVDVLEAFTQAWRESCNRFEGRGKEMLKDRILRMTGLLNQFLLFSEAFEHDEAYIADMSENPGGPPQSRTMHAGVKNGDSSPESPPTVGLGMHEVVMFRDVAEDGSGLPGNYGDLATDAVPVCQGSSAFQANTPYVAAQQYALEETGPTADEEDRGNEVNNGSAVEIEAERIGSGGAVPGLKSEEAIAADEYVDKVRGTCPQ